MSLHGNLEVCVYLLFLSANIQHGLQNFGKRYVLLLALCLMNKNYKNCEEKAFIYVVHDLSKGLLDSYIKIEINIIGSIYRRNQ